MATVDHVRRRIILLFVLGIGLPATLLGYLALRGVRNDQALLEREQREELREIAFATGRAHDSSLVDLERSLASVLAESESEGGSIQTPLFVLASDHPLIEAVFRLSPDGAVDELVAPDLLYRSPDGSSGGISFPLSAPEGDRLSSAQRLESQDRDFRGALAAYRGIASSQVDVRIRADAVAAIARLLRELGDYPGAVGAYRRLESEFGQVQTAGGIPFRLAALLELRKTQLLAGDTASAAAGLVDFYARLVRTERGLSRAQFGSMVTNLREPLDQLLSGQEGANLAALTDSVRVLEQEEQSARTRTERLLAFEESAGGELVASGMGGPGSQAGGYRRTSLSLGGQPFDLLLEGEASRGGEASEERWGILLDPDALRESVVATLQTEIGSRGIQWSLRGPSGDVVSTSEGASPAEGLGRNGIAAVSVSLPGGVPPLNIDLVHPEEGLVRTLLTSGYFYGFLLLAGILVFGLVLTVVTVSHQLALARLQSDFVSTVSHEFKSPLTAVRQVAETLHSGRVPSEEKRQKYYDILLEQSERLSLLIDRVLEFARMDSGEHTFSVGPVDVGKFLKDMVAQAQHRFGHEGFEIKGELQSDHSIASFDADALGQAVSNLIDNAVKYSGDSREIVVRGFTENGTVAIAVKDSGIGLDREEQTRVFERFYRGGDALTRSVKGTGLGLTLVRQIVEGHGGRVDVESELGRGSTFTIRLPQEGVGE